MKRRSHLKASTFFSNFTFFSCIPWLTNYCLPYSDRWDTIYLGCLQLVRFDLTLQNSIFRLNSSIPSSPIRVDTKDPPFVYLSYWTSWSRKQNSVRIDYVAWLCFGNLYHQMRQTKWIMWMSRIENRAYDIWINQIGSLFNYSPKEHAEPMIVSFFSKILTSYVEFLSALFSCDSMQFRIFFRI